MAETKIEWADRVWNPVTGCTKISPGCAHCYAERMAKRLAGRFGYSKDNPFAVTLHPESAVDPVHWRKPKRIFLGSMTDLFHDEVPFEFLDQLMAAVAMAHWHTFMILTKRPARMLEYFTHPGRRGEIARWWSTGAQYRASGVADDFEARIPWPLSNLQVGATVEDQPRAIERVPVLLYVPAVVRFLSLEPLLGPVDLTTLWQVCSECGSWEIYEPRGEMRYCDDCGADVPAPAIGIRGVIVGGETGPKARPAHPDWFRSLRDQCQAAGVAFFLKHLGEWRELGRYNSWPKYRDNVGVNSSLLVARRRTLLNADGSDLVNGGPDHKVYPISHLERVGKKQAGRELDGRTWDELPEERA